MVQTSVIIPTFNRAATILRAVDSVLKNDSSSLEIIIVDDGSTDDTSTLIHNYHPSILFIRQENQGAAAARNRGIRAAQGEFIAFLDADDEWRPGKLQRQLDVLAMNPGVSFVGTGGEFLTSEGKLVRIQSVYRRGNLLKELIFTNYIITSSVLVTRDSLLREKELFRPELIISEDWDLWLRLSASNQMIIIPDNLVSNHRLHDSLESSSSVEQIVNQYINIISNLNQDPLLGPVIDRNWSNIIANSIYMHAYYAYLRGDIRTARLKIIKAFLAAPARLKWSTALAILFLHPNTFERIKLQMNKNPRNYR